MTARLIKGVAGMAAVAALAGVLVSFANPQPQKVCVRIAVALVLGGCSDQNGAP